MSKQNSWLFTPTCSFPVFFVGNGISISPFLRLKSKSESHSVMSDSLKPYQLYSSWNFSCQNTGVGSLSLLQGILPTQGLNPGLLHCRQNLYQLSHQGSPRILEWVGYPFSSRSSWPRNQTRISCIAGGFFTNWAIREALRCLVLNKHLRYPSSKWIHKRQQFYLISYSFPWSSNT